MLIFLYIQVAASGLGLYQAQVSKVASFSIDTLGRPAREFDVVVSGPGARALPVRCYQTKSGLLQAEFSINEVGQSTIGEIIACFLSIIIIIN